MFDEYMTMYNTVNNLEQYRWIFIVVVIILVAAEQYFKSRNRHYNAEYLRNLHMQETRLRSAKRELDNARLELKKERMQFDSDYRVYCARFEGRNRH